MLRFTTAVIRHRYRSIATRVPGPAEDRQSVYNLLYLNVFLREHEEDIETAEDLRSGFHYRYFGTVPKYR
jgi:hypothetical protein